MGIPDKLGRYEVRRKIGVGGMAVVYEATDPVIQRRVAVKVLRSDLGVDPENMEELKARFQREFRSAGLLSHPGIVTIHDVGAEGEIPYIAMEYVDGGGLDELIKGEGSLPPQRVAELVSEVASALDYAHDQGIVHRDVKPGNILLDSSGRAKVMDFGIAKLEDMSMTRTGIAVGTPAYMSPEQITGGNVSGRSDQFALANIAYELLTGNRPFSGDSATSIMYQIVHATPPTVTELNADLPARIDGVLRKGMAKKPEARYSTCSEFARDLELAVREVVADRQEFSADATVVLSSPVRRPGQEDAGADDGADAPPGEAREEDEATADSPPAAEREEAEIAEEGTVLLGERPAETPSSEVTDSGAGVGPPQPRTGSTRQEAASEDLPEEALRSGAEHPGLGARAAALLEQVPHAGRIAAAVVVGIAVVALALMFTGGEEPEVVGDTASADAATGSATPPAADDADADTALQDAVAYRIVSDPAGARLSVDGEVRGQETPARVELPVDAPHRLTLQLSGYEEYEYRIDEQEPYEGSRRLETIHVVLRPLEQEVADATPAATSRGAVDAPAAEAGGEVAAAETPTTSDEEPSEAEAGETGVVEPDPRSSEPSEAESGGGGVEEAAEQADEEAQGAADDQADVEEGVAAAAETPPDADEPTGEEAAEESEGAAAESGETAADQPAQEGEDGPAEPAAGDAGTAGSQEIVPLTSDVQPPQLLSRSVALELDADDLRAMREETRTLTVRALVNADGTVADARFYRIEPDFAPPGKSPQEFADIVERSVITHWRFRPAMKEGEPVRVWYMIRVTVSR